MTYRRYGIYMLPDGPLYEAGAAWLGWDSMAGRGRAQPDLPGLPEPAATLTRTPRKYGLHGTIKPPFHLDEGKDAAGLARAAETFCADQPPVTIPAMVLRRLGPFLAIVPAQPSAPLADLAAATVRALDAFRAPPSEAELARRRAKGLSPGQEALLQAWGYPYVMEEFRFHITLTGALDPDTAQATEAALAPYFAPVLQRPVVIDSLALMGEDAEGMFHLVHRYTLSG